MTTSKEISKKILKGLNVKGAKLDQNEHERILQAVRLLSKIILNPEKRDTWKELAEMSRGFSYKSFSNKNKNQNFKVSNPAIFIYSIVKGYNLGTRSGQISYALVNLINITEGNHGWRFIRIACEEALDVEFYN